MNRDLVHDIAQLVIAIILIVAIFLFLYMLYFGGRTVDPTLRESLVQVVGGLIGIAGTVVGFYFGTSLSSARKDATINEMTTTAASTAATAAVTAAKGD